MGKLKHMPISSMLSAYIGHNSWSPCPQTPRSSSQSVGPTGTNYRACYNHYCRIKTKTWKAFVGSSCLLFPQEKEKWQKRKYICCSQIWENGKAVFLFVLVLGRKCQIQKRGNVGKLLSFHFLSPFAQKNPGSQHSILLTNRIRLPLCIRHWLNHEEQSTLDWEHSPYPQSSWI